MALAVARYILTNGLRGSTEGRVRLLKWVVTQDEDKRQLDPRIGTRVT